MILDSSAIVALFLQELGHEELLHKLVEAPVTVISTATLVETAIVLSARMQKDARKPVQIY